MSLSQVIGAPALTHSTFRRREFSARRRMLRVVACLIAVAALVGLQTAASTDSRHGVIPGLPAPIPNVVGHVLAAQSVAPLSTSQCWRH
jgi:hypothetical protein